MLSPKSLGFYMPAEWHPHARCWMAWPCHEETWQKIGLERARKAYALVAKAIARFEPVTFVINPEDEKSARQHCEEGINYLSLPINDSWTRDTGPTFLLNEQNILGGIDWIHNAWGNNYTNYALDNKIAQTLIEATEAHYFQAPFVMEGGSFHVDGEGTLLTTRECLLNPNRNPHLSQKDIEHYLCEYLNIEKIIWLNQGLVGDETDGHVDEIACFIAPGKVVCLITNDTKDENYERLQENLHILSHSTDAKGRSLQVFTIEQPPATFLQGDRLTLSYINFYLANRGVVIPAFGYEKYDEAAKDLFKSLFPHYTITQLHALDVFAGGGGIHCITQQQPLSSKFTIAPPH